MSACAGSSTERTRRLYLLCSPGTVRPARAKILLKYFAGRSGWTARPAGQGFMSTQRRENRSRRTTCTKRAGVLGVAFAGPIARYQCACASGGTAPPGFTGSFYSSDKNLSPGTPVNHPSDEDLSPGTPVNHPSDEDLSPGTPVRLATISLQSDYRIVQLVLQELRRGSPPFWAGLGEGSGTPANHGSSLPHISSLSSLARLYRIPPRVPAGRRRWAERYDGQGNLYLQHAP
jgi:hypothetical protein